MTGWEPPETTPATGEDIAPFIAERTLEDGSQPPFVLIEYEHADSLESHLQTIRPEPIGETVDETGSPIFENCGRRKNRD